MNSKNASSWFIILFIQFIVNIVIHLNINCLFYLLLSSSKFCLIQLILFVYIVGVALIYHASSSRSWRYELNSQKCYTDFFDSIKWLNYLRPPSKISPASNFISFMLFVRLPPGCGEVILLFLSKLLCIVFIIYVFLIGGL